MDHVVTVGMVVKPLLALLGAGLAVGVVVWLFALFAKGFDH
jgi:hypothetical protein